MQDWADTNDYCATAGGHFWRIWWRRYHTRRHLRRLESRLLDDVGITERQRRQECAKWL